MEPSYRADTPSSSSSSSRYQKPTTTINPSSESAPARGAALAPARGEPSRPILTSSITDPSFATLQRQYPPSSTHTLGEPSDSVGGPSVVTTRSGRHLHLLAPLQSRTLSALSGARPSTSSSISAIGSSSSVPSSLSTHHSIPSIKIPANPYAGYPLPLSHSALSAGGSSSYTRGGNNDVGPPPFTSAGYDSHLYRYSHSPYGLAGSSSTPYLSLHSASSSAGAGAIDPLTGDRLARSPHPPLTASIRPDAYHLWPPSLGQHHDSRLSPAGPAGANRPYYSSPLNDIQPLSASPYQNYQSYLQSQQSSFPHPGHHRTLSSNLTVLPPLRPSSSGDGSSNYNHVSAPHTAVPTTSGRSPYQTHHRASPFFIPPPLRFNYSQSPPTPQHFHEQENGDMPPRRKAAPVAGTASYGQPTPSTPQTVNSSSAGGSSVRRRPSGPKGNGWTMEHTYDSVGQKKEVIVIDDSESPHHAANKPVTRKRTRAQAAAEAAALSQQSSQTNGHYAPSTVNGGGSSTSGSAKKRKVDDPYDIPAKKTTKPKASGTAGSTYTQTSAIQPRAAPVAPGVPPQPPWDDSEGHYIVRPDDVIGGRYKIVRLLGQGTFGKVVEARHIETRRKVAIKVIRAVQKYRDASKIEIRVLEALKKNDPPNANKCIHLDEYFDFRNHPCLVSELYGMSVYDFLKQNSFQPFPEKHIQDFAKSLLKSVDFLHRLKLVHTDLKPENILLVSNESRLQGPRVKNAKSKSILRSTDIRLIDFGSATFENEYHSSVVSTRHYRAPEIILGLPWSYPCDLFSIGCILVEFYTGDALFQTHDNLEHLAMMEVVMGKMPPRMIERGRQKKPEFFKGNKIDFPNSTVSRSSRKFVKGLKSLPEIIPSTSPQNRLFLDLIVRLLDFDPDSRISVAAALDHPYCRQEIPPPPLT